jgi:hypothetical protein
MVRKAYRYPKTLKSILSGRLTELILEKHNRIFACKGTKMKNQILAVLEYYYEEHEYLERAKPVGSFPVGLITASHKLSENVCELLQGRDDDIAQGLDSISQLGWQEVLRGITPQKFRGWVLESQGPHQNQVLRRLRNEYLDRL